MKINFGQDFATGLLFAGTGAAALWIGWDYNMGTSLKPGTGVLPAMLSVGLILVGAIIALRGFLAGDVAIEGIAWRPLLMVTLGTLAFGFLVDRTGFVVTSIVSMTLCAIGLDETRWAEFAGFLLIMIASGWAMFIWLLGMPIPTFALKW